MSESASEPSFDLDRAWQPYYWSEGELPSSCPRCEDGLEHASPPYVVTTETDGEPGDTFFMTNRGARFCLSCDCIVIDEDSVFEMLSHGRPDWDIGDDIAVAGIVDWEAAPDDQRDRPLMEIEPSPIVFFDGFGFEDELDDSGRRRRRPDRGSSGNDVSDRLRRKRREKWSGSDED